MSDPFVLTKGFFEEHFDPHAELHKKPLADMEDAKEVAEMLMVEFEEYFGGVSKTQLALQLWNWYSAEALKTCNCRYCKSRRKNEKAQGRG